MNNFAPSFVMSLPPHLDDPFSLFNVSSDFLQDTEFSTTFDFWLELDADFGAKFTFKNALGGTSIHSGLFETRMYLFVK
jgi:hypothetical protein